MSTRDKEVTSDPKQPLVSIITAVRNNVDQLQRAIDSVQAQTYPNLEHIIVDGASTDGTLDLIKRNKESLAIWVSEPDDGIYDAFNKGVALASGSLIGILNSDDYYETDHITCAVDTFLLTGADWVFGDIYMHWPQEKSIRIGADPLYTRLIEKTMPSIHQASVLAHVSLFKKHGVFRTNYRIASDYDWFQRITKGGAVGQYSDGMLANMTFGGVSTKMQRRAIWEGYQISVRNGYPLLTASRHWALRWLYPNGAPSGLQRLVEYGRQGMSVLSRRSAQRQTVALAPQSGLVQPTEIDLGRLQQAFLSARHLGIGLDDTALIQLAEIGRYVPAYRTHGNSLEVQQAATMMGATSTHTEDTIDERAMTIVGLDDAGELVATQRFGLMLVLVPAQRQA